VSRLVGANREYISEHLPHIAQLLTDDLDEILAHAEVFVVGSAAPEIAAAMAGIEDRPVVDLVRLADADTRRRGANYVGIGW
jgi:GDP-mannose 6-dehydrogenase